MHKVMTATKNYVRRNKRTIVVGGLLTTVIILQSRGIKSLNTFLQDHDLYNEYYYNNEI